MKYQEVLKHLYAMLPDFQQVGANAYKPGLERVEEFNRYLGSPDKKFLTIHVAGTNGKGSVSHMLASVLSEAGYKTGLYTSPHLYDFRERIRIDGEMIPQKEVVDFTISNLEKMEKQKLSFFEATVGMAFCWFATCHVEVAVIETGLGGRLDATNIIKPILSIITNIGMDHMSFLGNSLASIATEKGGIIKPGVPVVIGERNPDTDSIFISIARNINSEIYFAEDIFKQCDKEDWDHDTGKNHEPPASNERIHLFKRIRDNQYFIIKSDLAGDYQRHNLLTVLAALEIIREKDLLAIDEKSVKDGLANVIVNTGLKGRWQIVNEKPLTILDTGHNSHGIRKVVEQIETQRYQKLYIIFGTANDKDLETILPLLPKKAFYLFTQASVERALPAEELAGKASSYGLNGLITKNVREAVERARELSGEEDMIFIGGSTFVVADAGI